MLMCLFGACNHRNNRQVEKSPTVLITDESIERAMLVSVENQESTSILKVKDLQGQLVSEWRIGFPVIKLDIGDADGDGHINLLLITVKPTRKDPAHHLPRPFIFSIGNGHLYPRWLGSTFGYPLVDFRVASPGGIVVWMQQDSVNYLVARYSMQSFSPRFEQEIYSGRSKALAKWYFTQQ